MSFPMIIGVQQLITSRSESIATMCDANKDERNKEVAYRHNEGSAPPPVCCRFSSMIIRLVCISLCLHWILTAVAGLPTRSARVVANIDDPPANVLVCRILLFDIMFQDSNNERDDFFICNPVSNGIVASRRYSIDLPSRISTEHRAWLSRVGVGARSPSVHALEDFYVAIPEGRIDSINKEIGFPDPEAMYVLPNNNNNPQRHRHLERRPVTSIGTYTALVLRIVDNTGREPEHSVAQLSEAMFDTQGVSAYTQYLACSWGTFTVVPASGNGVLQVTVDIDSSQTDSEDVTALAEAEALAQLGVDNLYDHADFTLYVTPPMGTWIAYASVGGGYSVYNSKWAGYMTGIMHEIGHNLGLLHANEGTLGAPEARYLDYSGYMSGARAEYEAEDYPVQCFNGANHWELGWYHEFGHAREVDPENPEIVYIGAFADRDKFRNANNFQEYAVIKSGDYYVHYNGAWGINVNTGEGENRLTVTQQWTDGTYQIAEIDPIPGDEWTLDGSSWTIHVCDIAEGSSTDAEVLTVWMGNGQPDCEANENIPADTGNGNGACKTHRESCSTNDECCSDNCRPTGQGLVCLPNPSAQQVKNGLRISQPADKVSQRRNLLRSWR